MSFRLSPSVLETLQSINETNRAIENSVASVDNLEALLAIAEQASLTQEQILNVQRAYLNAIEPILQSEAIFNVVQQQEELRQSLLNVVQGLDRIKTVQIQTLRPLFETEPIEEAVEHPIETVEEYGGAEATPNPGEMILTADQEGIRVAWGSSLIAANKLMSSVRDQVDDSRYSDAQLKAATLLLTVLLFFGAFSAAQAAGAALVVALRERRTFSQAWEDTITAAEQTVEEFEE